MAGKPGDGHRAAILSRSLPPRPGKPARAPGAHPRRPSADIPRSVEEAKKELQAREFSLIVLAVMFDEGLDHAVKAMLANAFLNLLKFPDDREGNARLRRIIDDLILIDGDLHGGFKTVHAVE